MSYLNIMFIKNKYKYPNEYLAFTVTLTLFILGDIYYYN